MSDIFAAPFIKFWGIFGITDMMHHVPTPTPAYLISISCLYDNPMSIYDLHHWLLNSNPKILYHIIYAPLTPAFLSGNDFMLS